MLMQYGFVSGAVDAADQFKAMADSNCAQCAHYRSDDEYDWCHECMMECDHFQPAEEITDTDRENDRYNQEQDYLEEHLAEINRDD